MCVYENVVSEILNIYNNKDRGLFVCVCVCVCCVLKRLLDAELQNLEGKYLYV